MNDPERLSVLVGRLVRRVEPVQGARHDRDHDLEGHQLARVQHRAQDADERLALHVVHDEQQLAAVCHDVHDGHHVWAADARGEASLVEEHRHELGIGRELRVELLDGDRPREAGRPEEPPEVHRGHPARCDRLVERVAAHDADHWGSTGPTATVGAGYVACRTRTSEK